MKITVRREEHEGNIMFATEVTLDVPVTCVSEAIPIAAQMAAELALPGEGIVAGEVKPCLPFQLTH